jgi:hypothetical protein
MANLVSPEYTLKAFCDGMLGQKLSTVMTTASAEISLVPVPLFAEQVPLPRAEHTAGHQR